MYMRLFVLYIILLGLFTVFSFSLTAPNLVLTTWNPYWQFQTWMWETFFNNRPLLAYTYIFLISALFCVYILLLLSLKKTTRFILPKFIWILPFIIIFFSSTALSYDIFNYIFNAKMVAIYHADPHVKVALDFASDPWVRFMHNTHTPAPYAYGWTVLSLLPFSIGLGKFLTTWIAFKLFAVLSLLLTYASLWWVTQREKPSQLSLFILFFNPLLLIEIFSSAHNDLWMLWPVILSMGLLVKKTRLGLPLGILFSLLFLALSISIKFATLVVLPIWLLLLISKTKIQLPFIKLTQRYWPLLCSIALFIPLLTARSQQFHPWYLLWSLVWVPLIIEIPSNPQAHGIERICGLLQRIWPVTLIVFSLTSLLRYVPYLLEGEYSSEILLHQKIITWSAVVISGILLVTFSKIKKI